MAYKNKGINIHGMEYYSTARPYVNLAKCVSPWAGKPHDVFETDEFGFISSIDQGGTSTSTVTFRGYINNGEGSGGVFTGDYILSCIGYPGSKWNQAFWIDNLSVPGLSENNQHGTFVYDTANGRNHFSALIPLSALEAASPSRTIQLQLRRFPNHYWDGGNTSANNYPREYAFFRKADETLQRTGEKFRPQFYSALSNAAVIRTMELQQQNKTEITDWESRPRQSFFTQASPSGGVSLEDLVEFVNKVGTDFWWSVPTSATGDYITNAATYIANNLTSGKKLYFEWGNEPWNAFFPQNAFCESMGFEKYGGANGQPILEDTLKFYGFSSVKVWDYVEAAWTAIRGNDTDLVRILNTQAGNTWVGQQMLQAHYPDGQTVTQVSSFADAMAVAPYFGGSFGTAEGPYDPTGVDDGLTASSLDQIFTRINAATETPAGDEETFSGTNWSLVDAKAKMQRAKDYFVTDLGLRLFAYEGGHHLAGATGSLQNDAALTAKFQDIVADPRIYDAFIQYYANWDSVVDDVYCAFHYMSPHWGWTLWGMRESDSQAQTLEAAPMWKAWLDWAGDAPPTPPTPATRQDYAWRPVNFGSIFKDSPGFQREFGVMGASSILIPADTNAHEIVAAASSVGVSATHYLWGVSYCTSGTDSHAGIITDSESNNIAFVSAKQEGPTFLSFKGPVKLPANGGLTFTKTSNAQVSWITPYISTVYRKYDSDD